MKGRERRRRGGEEEREGKDTRGKEAPGQDRRGKEREGSKETKSRRPPREGEVCRKTNCFVLAGWSNGPLSIRPQLLHRTPGPQRPVLEIHAHDALDVSYWTPLEES